VVLDSRLQHSLERHQPDEGKRREEYEAKGVERRADAACGRYQTQGNQAAGDGAEEHARPARRLGDRRCASALEHEMLSRHEGDRCGTRVGLGLSDSIAGLAVIPDQPKGDGGMRVSPLT
jgi:hypothetical protein